MSFDPSIQSSRTPFQVVTATPTNPTGTASLSYVMMGLGVSITPRGTGRLRITVTGNLNQTTTADGANAKISHGTGGAPTNGAVLTGTQDGIATPMTFLTGVLTVPWSNAVIVSGLTVGVTYWVDLALAAVTGGTASVTNLYVTVEEY